jgi:glycerol kinase
VIRPTIKETTALGAAYAAGLAAGFFETVGDLCAKWSADKARRPRMPAKQRELMYQLWTKAVGRTFGWLDT